LNLAIATAATAPDINPDDAKTVELLRAAGAAVSAAAWNDPAVDWARFDVVVIRSTWDYHTFYADFLAWLARLEQLNVRTINPVPLLRWNSDKPYLLQLPRLGVETAPTEVVSARALGAALDSMPGRDIVIKPTVSASAWCTVRGRADGIDLRDSIAALPTHLDYLVQPFVPEVASEGEWSLLFFDGVYSHAVLKRPARGDYRVQLEFGGDREFIEPDETTIAAASGAISAVQSLGFERPVYARIDGVRSGGRFLIMEVEMIEPFLFLSGAVAASQRFADAIFAAVKRRTTTKITENT
jgi:glutathione synthase/RimK-type ligase-like ATP-grasp enzyme